MWKPLALIACGLLLAACLPVLAQDDPPEEGTGASGSSKSADDVQREALRALMGDDEGSRPSSGTSGSSGARSSSRGGSSSRPAATTSDAGPDDTRSTSRTRPATRDDEPADADEPPASRDSASRRGARSRSDDAPSDMSVPVVPSTPQTSPDGGLTPDSTQVAPSPYSTAPAPEGGYDANGQPLDPSAALPPDAAVTDNALAPANALDQEASGARSGSAIIIGLIILAVLLVALAAVVGVMAAHRSHPAEPLPGAPVPGWAYFTAPNAPNIGLQKTPFLMGSSQQCDLVLADPKASPEHARVDHTAEGYVLTDLNSLNGTYLNGQRIASPVVLRPGDEVHMGDIAIKFEVYS